MPIYRVTNFKLFMAYRGMLYVDDRTLIKTLAQAKQSGALVMVHAENGDAGDYLRDLNLAAGNTAPKYPARPGSRPRQRPPRAPLRWLKSLVHHYMWYI